MSKLNATKANKISKENNAMFIVDNILDLVKKATENGEFAIKVRKYGFGDSVLYTGTPKKIAGIINDLRELGYNAEIKVEEKQFVDIYLLVDWSDEVINK